jgi:alginate O-acetyltransferase complex protein AlgI
MVFSSHIFLFYFLPITLLLHWVLPRQWKNFFLIIASFVCYGWHKPAYVLLAAFSAFVDYAAGAMIAKDQEAGRSGKRWLVGSITTQLSLLAWFKYANFGVGIWNGLAVKMGGEAMAWENVALPVGISFYTFQTMSYTIDVYRKEVPRARSLVDFLCYVSMFPQLVSGPIVRYQHVEGQVRDRTVTFGKTVQGMTMLQAGLAKKLLIADFLGTVADAAFKSQGLSSADAWLGALCYTFQIYFDFSGYSDMAIGLALMLGFRYPINFDRPYLSTSITEFWRRWHISLSSWLRDYLYIPLGGNRKGNFRTYVDLALTMLLAVFGTAPTGRSSFGARIRAFGSASNARSARRRSSDGCRSRCRCSRRSCSSSSVGCSSGPIRSTSPSDTSVGWRASAPCPS